MDDLRSPLAKSKGLGASQDASNEFWVQRLTALALVPMVIWFCFSIALLPEISYGVLRTWFQSPFNSIMMVLIVLVSFQHAHMGMQVIFEDYISSYGPRVAAILLVKFLSYFLMAVGVFSILKIALGSQ